MDQWYKVLKKRRKIDTTCATIVNFQLEEFLRNRLHIYESDLHILVLKSNFRSLSWAKRKLVESKNNFS